MWRFDGERLTILQLQGGGYAECEASRVLGTVAAVDLSRLAGRSLTLKRTEWLKEVRSWVREQDQPQ